MTKTIGLMLLFIGVAGLAGATAAVPEIDAGTGGSALALLSGVLLVVRGRKR